MPESVADLYVLLSAQTAPMIASFLEAGAAGEAMAAQILAATTAVDTAVAEMGAALAASATEVTASDAELAAGADRAAVSVKAANDEIITSDERMSAAYRATVAEINATYSELGVKAGATAEEVSAANAKMERSWAANLSAAKTSQAEHVAGLGGMRTATAEAATAAEGLAAEAEGATLRTGAMGAAAGLATGPIGAAVVVTTGLGLAMLKMGADFQESTTRLVTSANETKANLDMVRQGILEMAGQVGYTAEALATAMYKVESGGQHGADGLRVLQAAAEGAKTENADLTTVADALTSAMTDYHLPATAAADVTSKLVAATASGKMTFQELAGSMSAILPIASANHVSLNDILGDLASMTMHGMSAQQASQNLADAIRHMAAPTQQQQKEFALLGLNAKEVSDSLGTQGLSGTVNMLGDRIRASMGPGASEVILNLTNALSGLDPRVKELASHVVDGSMSLKDYTKAAKDLPVELAKQATSFATLAGSTHQIGGAQKDGATVLQNYAQAMRAAMGDATGLNVALMISGENAGNTATAIKNVSEATAQADGHVKGWDEIQGNFNQKLSQAWDGLQAMAISIGEKLLPVLTPVIGMVADFTEWLTKNKDVTDGLAVVFGVFVGALAVAVGAIVAIAAAIGFVVGLIAHAVGAIIDNWGGIVGFFSGIWDAITGFFKRGADFIGRIWDDIVGGFQNTSATIESSVNGIDAFFLGLGQVVGQVIDWFTNLPGMIGDAVGAVGDFFAGLPGKVGAALSLLGSAIVQGVSQANAWLAQPFIDAWNAVHDFFAQGPRKIGEELGAGAAELVKGGARLITGLTNGILAGWESVKTFLFTTLPQTVESVAVSATTWLVKTGTSMVVGLRDGIVGGAQAVWTFFTATLPQAIAGFVVSSATWLLTTGASLIRGLNQGIIDTWHTVTAWFAALPGRIGDFFAGAGTWLLDKGRALITGSRDGITSEWSTVVAWFVALPGRFAEFFSGAERWLIQSGADILAGLWNGITSFFGTIWSGITGFISGFIDAFRRGLGIASPSTIFLAIGADVVQGLWNGVVNLWGAFVGFVHSLPQTIIGVFSGAGSWLVDAGRNVVMGLWNGIQQLGSWLWGQVSSWASGIINAAKSALGIRSPSVHAVEMGRFLAEGLAAGLDAHTQIATAAASRMSRAVLDAASPGGVTVGGVTVTGGGLAGFAAAPTLTGLGSQSGTTGSSGGDIHVHINAAGSILTDQDLGRMLQDFLLRNGVRNSGSGITYSGFGSGR